ncbi:MAG: hypothetical protein OEZ34_03355 [Spirochaetia bacterium]|nr:hypothetical protein [Spirochaetia bacterium]
MKKWIPVILIFLSSTALLADKRLYSYNGNSGEFVSEFIDVMTGEGIRFSVKSVYNEEKDGKQGMVLIMKPSGKFCEVTFADKKKGSVISLFAQDSNDMALINSLFLRKMRMSEVGTKPKNYTSPPGSGGWPDPGLR